MHTKELDCDSKKKKKKPQFNCDILNKLSDTKAQKQSILHLNLSCFCSSCPHLTSLLNDQTMTPHYVHHVSDNNRNATFMQLWVLSNLFWRFNHHIIVKLKILFSCLVNYEWFTRINYEVWTQGLSIRKYKSFQESLNNTIHNVVMKQFDRI